MRWYWIGRWQYEQAQRETQEAIDSNVDLGLALKKLETEVHNWTDRYDSLLERFVSLKREGFMEGGQPAEYTAPPAPEALPTAVREAIHDRAIPGTPLARELARVAARELELDKDEEDVAELILEGGEYE